MPSGRLSLTRCRADKKKKTMKKTRAADSATIPELVDDVVDLCEEAETERRAVGPSPAQNQQHTQRRNLRVVKKKQKQQQKKQKEKKKKKPPVWALFSMTSVTIDLCDADEDPIPIPGSSSAGVDDVPVRSGCASGRTCAKGSAVAVAAGLLELPPERSRDRTTPAHQLKESRSSSPADPVPPLQGKKEICLAPSAGGAIKEPSQPVAVASHLQPKTEICHASSANIADAARKEPAEPVAVAVVSATASGHNPAPTEHSASLPWPSAYLNYFRRVLQATIGPPLTIHTHLFLANEIQWISDFRALSDPAAGLFCRLFLRNGPWFRTTEKTMSTYHEVSQSSAILDKAIDELLQAGFLHQLLKTSTNEQCAAALLSAACNTSVCELVYESLLKVSAKKSREKCMRPSGMAKASGRRSPRPRRKSELVQRLMQELPRQLDVFGRTRSIAPRLIAVLSNIDNEAKSRGASTQRNRRKFAGASPSGSKCAVGFPSSRQVHAPRTHPSQTLRTRLICLNGRRARLFCRLEFLFSLGSWSSVTSLRTSASSSQPSSQHFSTPSLQQPPRSALMEMFGKMTFAKFSCADPLTCRPLFSGREAFVRYEEACIGVSKFEVAIMQGAVSASGQRTVALTGFGDSVPECAASQPCNAGDADNSHFYHWPDYADEIAACGSFYLARLLAEQTNSSAAQPVTRKSEKLLFLRQYEAGSALALIVWLGVDVVQKQRRYEEAVKMLELLLRCPYARQRRGRWWTRLLIDLDHLRLRLQKQKRAALQRRVAAKPSPGQHANASWGEDSDSSEGATGDTKASDDHTNGSPAKKAKIAPAVGRKHCKDTSRAPLASIQAAVHKLDMRIAVATIAALDDCIHNNCADMQSISSSKANPLSGSVAKSHHRIGTVQDGVLISAPDQAALLQRSIAIRKRLARLYSTAPTSSSPSTRASSCQRARRRNAAECDHELLQRLMSRVDTAIASAADVALAADWSPPALTIKGTPLNCEAGKKSRFVGYDGSTNVSVEELVLQYFALLPEGQDPEDGGFSQHGPDNESIQPVALAQTISTGWQGIHCEGSVVRSLFALLMWDVIFLSGPDTSVPPRAFLSPFQGGPLDFDTASDSPAGFYLRRKKQADVRLAELAAMNRQQISEAVFKSWTAHLNCLCHGMRWPNTASQYNRMTSVGNEHFVDGLFGAPEHGDQSYNHERWQQTPALLQLIGAGLGGRRLSAVCRRLCVDYHGCRAGFPDLLLWKVTAHCPQPSTRNLRDLRMHDIVKKFVEQCKLTELTRQTEKLKPDEPTPSPAEARAVCDVLGVEGNLPHFTMIPPTSSGVNISIRFAEVKGPRDTLSSQQVEWLRYFNNPDQCEGGIEAHVVHVEETKGGNITP